MTSNLASEEIAEHGMQLRQEAERIFTHRLDKNANEDQEPEQIKISRNFKDEVVSLFLILLLIGKSKKDYYIQNRSFSCSESSGFC